MTRLDFKKDHGHGSWSFVHWNCPAFLLDAFMRQAHKTIVLTYMLHSCLNIFWWQNASLGWVWRISLFSSSGIFLSLSEVTLNNICIKPYLLATFYVIYCFQRTSRYQPISSHIYGFLVDCGPTELTSTSGTITPPLNAGNTGFLFGRECAWKIQVFRVVFGGCYLHTSHFGLDIEQS